MAWLSTVRFDGAVGLHGKSITIPVVLDAHIAYPPGSESTGGPQETLKRALDYGVIREEHNRLCTPAVIYLNAK